MRAGKLTLNADGPPPCSPPGQGVGMLPAQWLHLPGQRVLVEGSPVPRMPLAATPAGTAGAVQAACVALTSSATNLLLVFLFNVN